MTELDLGMYQLHLMAARRELRLAVFEESKHPRGHGGKFRKGTSIKTIEDAGKVTRVVGDKVYFTPKGQTYESSRPARSVVRADAPRMKPEDVTTGDDLHRFGVQRDVRIEPGEKMSPEAHREIATAIDAVWDKYPEFKKRKYTKAVGIIWAHSATDKGDTGGSAQIRANPKTVMIQKRDSSSSEIWINDDRMGEPMQQLTNPAGDKKGSAAHERLAGIVLHELGHALLYERGRGEEQRVNAEYEALGKDWITEHVSWQAAQSPRELQAEAFALVNASWVKLDDDVRTALEKVVG